MTSSRLQARSRKRKIIIHRGPTNSGKTHHAVEALMAAESGVYCGPLRLLASEMYDKMKKNGKLKSAWFSEHEHWCCVPTPTPSPPSIC